MFKNNYYFFRDFTKEKYLILIASMNSFFPPTTQKGATYKAILWSPCLHYILKNRNLYIKLLPGKLQGDKLWTKRKYYGRKYY